MAIIRSSSIEQDGTNTSKNVSCYPLLLLSLFHGERFMKNLDGKRFNPRSYLSCLFALIFKIMFYISPFGFLWISSCGADANTWLKRASALQLTVMFSLLALMILGEFFYAQNISYKKESSCFIR